MFLLQPTWGVQKVLWIFLSAVFEEKPKPTSLGGPISPWGGVAVNIILGFIEAHSSTAGDPGRNGEGQEEIKPSVPTIRSILMADAIP